MVLRGWRDVEAYAEVCVEDRLEVEVPPHSAFFACTQAGLRASEGRCEMIVLMGWASVSLEGTTHGFFRRTEKKKKEKGKNKGEEICRGKRKEEENFLDGDNHDVYTTQVRRWCD